MMNLTPEILAYFSSLIEKETGIQYQETNKHSLANRLRDLANFLSFPSVEALWLDIKQKGLNAAAKSMILDMATNNETSFFRDPEVFDFFRSVFVPKIAPSVDKIKIWCAACSTGQEPYSLAILLEELREKGAGKNYQILVSDISERVLKQTESGIYSQLEIQRGLPAMMMVKYFDQLTNEPGTLPKYAAKKFLSREMTFKRINLLDTWLHQGPFDIVFCRNVLIYQSVENKKKVIAKIVNILAPGGYLVLGGAESLLGLSDAFETELYGKACVYKLKMR